MGPARLDRFDAEGDALIHELRLADWPSPDSNDAINASGLRREDDRGWEVYSGVDVNVGRGQVLVVHGHGPVGKSAFLFTLAGRVRRIVGDLKVLGHVLPQHLYTVRREVTVISCHETLDPAADVKAALDNDIELILLDDVDVVVRNETRSQLRQYLSNRKSRSGNPVTIVVTCQDPALISDLLPAEPTAVTLELSSESVEVAR
jgi:RND superfamily putative drug exporter